MSKLWKKIVRPVIFALDAERAHEIGMKALEIGLASPFYGDAAAGDLGPVEQFGLRFSNPVGIAAGFDKNAVAVGQLGRLGFGFVEVGTVTFRPQPGNPKPRLFRLPKDQALINRLGFNNDGAHRVTARLGKLDRKCIVGVNIGKNKDVPNDDAVENYLSCFDIVHPVADYIAVNISSPNTPNLRELQKADSLDELLGELQKRNSEVGRKPLLVKIAPDLSDGEIESIVGVCKSRSIAGIIATNTTVSREGVSKNAAGLGAGGLSGRPLRSRATRVISMVYRYSNGSIPIVGVGGVFSPEDAFEKIAAGASLVQAYTGFVYGGPSFARELNLGLRECVLNAGFSSLDEAVGSGVKI